MNLRSMALGVENQNKAEFVFNGDDGLLIKLKGSGLYNTYEEIRVELRKEQV